MKTVFYWHIDICEWIIYIKYEILVKHTQIKWVSFNSKYKNSFISVVLVWVILFITSSGLKLNPYLTVDAVLFTDVHDYTNIQPITTSRMTKFLFSPAELWLFTIWRVNLEACGASESFFTQTGALDTTTQTPGSESREHVYLFFRLHHQSDHIFKYGYLCRSTIWYRNFAPASHRHCSFDLISFISPFYCQCLELNLGASLIPSHHRLIQLGRAGD